ncbi:MAG TPA: XRE family transcriptional regulator [Spirochaetota bacterium]|nr:XRE family transcriptional regulator [Spirochaetota bacterium]HPC40476.1 XRE family transcriptional regulator [Spirochaetota bacterium]HPL15785.1 XRE family transcriptional regulator [Spirochaetota bacterium]HQF06543.1 XRE family transcriptional regulator [Spirochaetota bacterium]HQH96054.1 XRE family transcriptional regulator [Spirochaetota bacterium]
MGKKQTLSNANPTGAKIKTMRTRRRVPIEELSEMTGLSVSHLAEIEKGSGFAPVGDLLKIARALTIDPGELLRRDTSKEKELEKQRIQDFKKRKEAYQYEVLTPQAAKDHLRAFRVVIPPRSEHPGVRYQHEGEEFVYALKGEVIIQVGQKKHRLKKDQSLHFNSGIRHTLKNPGGSVTVLIVTIYTP